MSKAQPQTRPSHIVIFNGKPFNNDVSIHDIHSLKEYAEQEHFDLESECRNQFNVPVEWVSREQRNDLFSQVMNRRAERIAATYHYHRCIECKEASACSDKDCKKTEIECRLCHDGDLRMTRNDYWMHNRQVVMQ